MKITELNQTLALRTPEQIMKGVEQKIIAASASGRGEMLTPVECRLMHFLLAKQEPQENFRDALPDGGKYPENVEHEQSGQPGAEAAA